MMSGNKKDLLPLFLFIVTILVNSCFGFIVPRTEWSHRQQPAKDRRLRASSSSSSSPVMVDELLTKITDYDNAKSTTTRNKISSLMDEIEEESQQKNVSFDSQEGFDDLIGFYNVTCTLTTKPNQNPVGGKWTRSDGIAQRLLVSTKRTMQHLLPVNTTGIMRQYNNKHASVVAEAINVIIVQALFGFFRIHILLRGDAIPVEKNINTTIPLSNRAVRVLFDPPRIVIQTAAAKRSLFNLQVGPTSSVVLDSPYVDSKVRFGRGGLSGTRFVFTKCSDYDQEAKLCIPMLQQRPVAKLKAAISLGFPVLGGLAGLILKRNILWKALGFMVSAISLLFMGLILTSSGGIEQNDLNYQVEKERTKELGLQ